MRQVTRKGLMTMAAATGVIAAAGGAAHADSGAHGSSSGSPGVLSGNTVQAPVHVPVNVCGNTVDVVGVLNPAMGNSCANQGGDASGGHGDPGGYGDSGSHDGAHGDSGGSHAGGHATDSPGVGSGNHVEVPIDVPVNVCGNSIDVVGALNPAFGNDCDNGGGGGDHSTPPGDHETPPEKPDNPDTPDNPSGPDGDTPGDSTEHNRPGTQTVAQPGGHAALAETGSDLPLGLVLPVGAGALLAGTVLYRKARASA
ncbi:chaplin [Streptomyces coelicoflavus]|uniref:chaplin n=1 Tax=Streptomyces coelicoflavus TaxID=285562 RepID=UPI000D599A59|nr:chaplin [Streptomyces coelicoflavus]